MRIGIDVRALSGGKNTGVEEYIRNLLPILFALDRKIEYVLFFNSFSGECPAELREWADQPNISLARYAWPNKLLNGLFWLLGWPFLEFFTGPVDVFFFPNMNFFSLQRKTPFVMTFHDLSYEHFPHFFNRKRRLWHFLINPRKRALQTRKIIAVSAFTAYDLGKTYRLERSKTEVTHLGLSQKFLRANQPLSVTERTELLKKYCLPDRPFFLFLGTVEPRKNLAFLIKVFNLYKQRTGGGEMLLITGGRGWSFERVLSEFEKSPFRQDIFFVGSIEDVDRWAIYSAAEIFIFPSLFEGFGLPPLEAMACGTPVLASASASMIEILGDKALLSNPYDVAEFEFALERLKEDEEFCRALSAAGRKYVQKFTWRKTAEKTLAVLRSAAR